jgi:hypothetical protein
VLIDQDMTWPPISETGGPVAECAVWQNGASNPGQLRNTGRRLSDEEHLDRFPAAMIDDVKLGAARLCALQRYAVRFERVSGDLGRAARIAGAFYHGRIWIELLFRAGRDVHGDELA